MHAHIERSNLDNWVIHISSSVHLLRTSHIIVLILSCNVKVFVKCSDDKIENWNDICGVIFELSIERVVKLINMITIDIKDVLFSFMNFSKPLDIEWLS